MKKLSIAVVIIALLASCKAKQAVVAESAATGSLSAQKIIEGHYAAKRDFKTVAIKASAAYEDARQSQNVSAEVRIKNKEKILVIIRVLGITMAKALITPTQVRYYEKINGTYFEGDYAKLSRWLGTDLDYHKAQNLLMGEAMDDLTKGTYAVVVENGVFKLTDNTNGTKKAFSFEAGNFLVKGQEISQPAQQRSIEVDYPAHREYPAMFLPASIRIDALNKKAKISIDIDYQNATFDENLTFPYSVPDGYEKIDMD